MTEGKTKDRLEFLAEKFDVFEIDKISIDAKIAELSSKEAKPNYKFFCETDGPMSTKNRVLAIITTKTNDKSRETKKVSVSLPVFTSMVAADPTPNKSCVQWMLNVFTRFILNGEEAQAYRFVIEDLPQAKEYITLFEANKRKNKFKTLCESSYILKKAEITDPTDINQYKSLSQLFDAIDPFIERAESTGIERSLNRFVESKQAIIPVRDRKFTLYIPKTVDASTVFNGFANWCTTSPGNGMFTRYTTDNKTSLGTNSKLYIIINNKFFSGESDELYQIHVETNQIKDRHNSQNVSIFETVLNESEGLSNFFYEELMVFAKACKTGIDNNKYLDFLIKFGFAESLFELMDENTPVIKIMTREIPKLPDLSRFKVIDELIITDAKMMHLHPSIGKLTNLELISFSGNKIKALPKEIGNLKKLEYMNLNGNPIEEIPDEIKYLDKENGGSIFRIAVKENEIGTKNYKRLRELLPNAMFA